MHAIPERRPENRCEGRPFAQGCPIAKLDNQSKNMFANHFRDRLMCQRPENRGVWLVWEDKRKRDASRALIIDLAHHAAHSKDLTLRN